jgi:hypothetical protein
VGRRDAQAQHDEVREGQGHAADLGPHRGAGLPRRGRPARASGTTWSTSAVADGAGLQTGKEFGNRGQCNPTYFTVGIAGEAPHRPARHPRDVVEDIVKNYVFLTAGACGPCRFGMYVTEYRKALRDAGFDGFRVMLFQQQGGLSQATGDDVGLEMNPEFFIAIIKAIVCGDVVNALSLPHPPLRGRARRDQRGRRPGEEDPLRGPLHEDQHLHGALPRPEGASRR